MLTKSNESDLARATRRSMKKHFPLGAVTSLTNDNPVTLHNSVDDKLFACVWSVMAETMCVTIELRRSTKEAIATLVSERNVCPVCISVHTLCGVLADMVVQVPITGSGMDSTTLSVRSTGTSHSTSSTSVAAEQHQSSKKKRNNKMDQDKREKQHEEALQYAGELLDELNNSRRADSSSCGASLPSNSKTGGNNNNNNNNNKSYRNNKGKSKRDKKYSHLNRVAQAEVALIVMFYDHMNRVVSVILGDQLSTAMLGMPRSIARVAEKPDTMRMIGKFLSPLISSTFKAKNEPGMTKSLFTGGGSETTTTTTSITKKALPPHLQGLPMAGLERAHAVSRLLEWVETFENGPLREYLTQDHIDFLERETKVSHAHNQLESPQAVLRWVETTVTDEISTELKEIGTTTNEEEDNDGNNSNNNNNISFDQAKAVTVVLLLATYAPKTAYQGRHWNALVDHVGNDMARSIVAWWSLRCSLSDAKGLDREIDAKSMRKLLLVSSAAA